MSLKSHGSKDAILSFIANKTLNLIPTQIKLIEKTKQHPMGMMLGAPEQLQFLGQMAVNIGAKKTLDVGVFTGYSALSIALVLPPGGKVVACDVSEEYTNIGKPFWKEAGVESKIDLRIAPALQTLQCLLDKGEAGTFDFAFIDADKENYEAYYELCFKLLRPGGIIAFDNMLWGGKVADLSVNDASTVVLRQLSIKLSKDPRVNYSLLNSGDGTGIAFKK